MLYILVPYSFLILFCLFGVVVSIGRVLTADNSEQRVRALVYLLDVLIIIVICGASVYLCLYTTITRYWILAASTALVLLTHFTLGQYGQPTRS